MAVILLRGPLAAILGPLFKVCEYILKPLLFVQDVVPPPGPFQACSVALRPVLEVFAVASIGGTLAYLCYRGPGHRPELSFPCSENLTWPVRWLS